jgi:hypothetical protein
MIKCFGFLLFICNAGIVLAADREFGHPIFRTFTAHDYGEVGQIFAIAEDPQGRMLFGCEDAILVFDNNRWETIPTPETGFIRSFAADNHGVVGSVAVPRLVTSPESMVDTGRLRSTTDRLG